MTLALWNKVQAKLLPTPAKFHYLFNMRELSKVGIINFVSHKRFIITAYDNFRLVGWLQDTALLAPLLSVWSVARGVPTPAHSLTESRLGTAHD